MPLPPPKEEGDEKLLEDPLLEMEEALPNPLLLPL
jgi:hypothetical protein